jgi:hypothetical protein
MNQLRKIKNVYLLFLVIGIISLILLLLLNLQRSSVVDDTAVSGFGANATNDLYDTTQTLFINADCSKILGKSYTNNPQFPIISKYNFDLTATKLASFTNMPLACKYELADGTYVTFAVNAYNKSSKIDASRSDLFDRVNTSLKTVIDSGRIGIIDYYSGEDPGDSTICRTNIFHPLNDFESAQITYYGYQCDSIASLNRELVTAFGHYLVTSMEYVYAVHGGTSTEALLTKWGFADLVPKLEFYSAETPTDD